MPLNLRPCRHHPLSRPTPFSTSAFPRKVYGQRWKVETLILVVKCRFGGAVTTRRYSQQVKQTLLRAMTYNLYRAVQLGLWVHLRPHRPVKTAA